MIIFETKDNFNEHIDLDLARESDPYTVSQLLKHSIYIWSNKEIAALNYFLKHETLLKLHFSNELTHKLIVRRHFEIVDAELKYLTKFGTYYLFIIKYEDSVLSCWIGKIRSLLSTLGHYDPICDVSPWIQSKALKEVLS